MPLLRNGAGCAVVLAVWIPLFTGCTSGPQPARVSAIEQPSRAATAKAVAIAQTAGDGNAPRIKSAAVTPVNFEEPADGRMSSFADDEAPFAGQVELSLPLLVSEVQRRNPTLQAALAAWGAASERCPQVVALEDPIFQSMLAPGSFPSASSVQASYLIGISQKIPWAGKRALRGQVAQAEANAASFDSQDVRLRLAEATRLAFFEYYLVRRDLELNTANREAVERFRETANAKFEANQVTEQDVLQADVELGMLRSRRIELAQNERIAVARINTLLHREPQIPLPPPPQRLEVADSLPDVEALRQAAIQQRPDLTAQAARIEAEKASVALACKEFYPDFEFMGRYDNFWTAVEQRGQVGMYMNIPLNQSRRQAALREAIFKVSKMQAEYDAQADSIRNEVEAAVARLDGSRQNVRLYSETILPASEANVASANAGYEAGKIDFLRLVEAERQLIELQEKYQDAVTEYHRRRAELERAVGEPLPNAGEPGVGTELLLDE